MKVELKGVTQPRNVPECDTAEDLVAYCARVSNPTNQGNKSTGSKLVKFLINEKHWSPLEMVHVLIEINTTRDIARQILRHRSFSFQEFSQRYAAVVDFSDPREGRLQDLKNRQNSIETDDAALLADWEYDQQELLDIIQEMYSTYLDRGLAKEVVRAILPEGLTTSKIYMSGTLRSWVHYCQLRMANGTQKEHREIAENCWAILCKEFPAISELV